MVWAALFFTPYFLAGGQVELSPVAMNTWVPLGLYAVIFYLNYFYLINAFLFNKKNTVFILINLVLIGLLAFLNYELKEMYLEHILAKNKTIERPPHEGLFIYLNSITFVVPLVFALAFKTIEKWKKDETRTQEAEKIKLESELQYLRYQLQPHFFFNSLNNIYSLVDIAPDQAKETIHSLSKLMRYLLYETATEYVPLQKEIDFLKTYIELMKLRFSSNVIVNYSFPAVSGDVRIAPLLIITLIENAFKHGISSTELSRIDFKISVEEETIKFVSVNNYYPKDATDQSGSGIGLLNLDKRLQLIYGNDHKLKIDVQNDLFISKLNIPVR
tara:strand:+ start:308 stop:1297 length:990 start_codon:yes stop_codon:yes gene_type:complete